MNESKALQFGPGHKSLVRFSWLAVLWSLLLCLGLFSTPATATIFEGTNTPTVVPFSPAFPHALSIIAPGTAVTTSASFTVNFNQPVTGVDAADFDLMATGTVANGTVSSVTGSGAEYTVNVTGITGAGTLGLSLANVATITALPSFATQATFATGSKPASVTLGDVNGDGKLDMITANFNSANVSVLLGDGTGAFQGQQTFATGTQPFAVRLGDVNGDGSLDIITANQGSSNLSVLLGNGDGTFAAQTTFATGTSPSSVALGDVNGDGRLDITTASYSSDTASVLLGNGDGTFQTQSTFAAGDSPLAVALGDLNGDGRLDIATANFDSGNTSVLLNSIAFTGQTAAVVNAANTPTFGTPTRNADGFTFQISNYDANFAYGGTATAGGTVSISGTGLVSVSGVVPNTSSTVTVSTTRAGYANGSAQVTATSLNAANTPTFGTPTRTAVGFTVQISNYDANFAYGGTATAGGIVSISGTGLVTVSGVFPNTSSTATVTTTRANYASGSAQVTAVSLAAVADNSGMAPIPTLSAWMLMVLAGLMAFVAIRRASAVAKAHMSSQV